MMTFFKKTSLALAFLTVSVTAFANNGINPPTQDNAAYVLMDYDTGTVLAQSNADTPLPPASLTKMMTSYILEQKLLSGELSETTPIKVSETAWCRGSSSQSCMYVPLGESATAIDMLRGIIVQSGNDASIAVAEHISGSESAFAVIMNDEAAKLGMTNTHFANATGMPAEGHRSSAHDLAVLARTVIKNSAQYYPIYSEKEFTYNNIKQGNRNALLFTDATVDGLKTGHTSESGYSLAASSHKDNMRLIAIVLGAKSMQARADQARELLDFGFGHFTNVVVATSGTNAGNIPVKFSKNKTVTASTLSDLKVLTTKNQTGNFTTAIKLNDNITAPIKKGQELGQMMAVLDGRTVASTPIIADEDAEQAGFVSRMWESLVDWIKGLF
ncbi:D-alanyl-D-alanine carboxypeptidase [Moraxella sp. K127]|nr:MULTISPECIES: D-alanyl-D-alanine carboxypeptidase family protein [Moraxella]MBE9579158.1 D-alanyl-D-alanine carboxypeptidase [Moraxella sp. K1664]MBE9588428.1 D-alanyl-D-alanine carboxypeptidase [Moraxella sp. K1630]MBE9590864.1 D-alanyl-D-alanine carboxypeptidase [Moraxella sp. K127]MBE9596588.1 D-alanyl-D-alanine carboxypeptidase [Moraxella sp. K2450]MDH9219140.1 D-alanyl-D-alanine carboxypeptidase [Moraxella lacunata]